MTDTVTDTWPRVLQKGFAFKQKVISKQAVSGVWSTLGSPDVAFLMARAGLDFILVDLEHGAGDIGGLAAQSQAILSLDTAIMVRCADHSTSAIKRSLDAGANCLLMPSVNSASEAKAIVAAAKFSPEGDRGVAVGAIPASDFGYEAAQYFTNANSATTIIVQIETLVAIDEIEAMAAVPGVDGFFIGPNDLSASMGLFRQYEHPDVIAAIKKIEAAVKRTGKVMGCLPYPGSNCADLQKRGHTLATAGADQVFLREACLNIVATHNEGSQK